MTGWRRSRAQEKKLGRPLVYLPRQHDPARAAWRGLAGLLYPQESDSGAAGRGADESKPSGVVQWLAMLSDPNGGVLPEKSLFRTRLVGAVYGTQQSVVDEVVDDGITLPVVLLHEHRPLYGAAAVDAVADAEKAVAALGHLAGNLARATGAPPGPATDTARDRGFGALDGPYRHWVVSLGESADPVTARAAWQADVRRIVLALGRELLDGAGRAAAEGRVVELPGVGKRWVDSSRADLWFRTRINKVLPKPPSAPPVDGHRPDDNSPEGPEGTV